MNKCALLIFLLAVTVKSLAQDITISGYVRDEKSKETLIGVSIFSTETKTGTTTNEYGFYSFTVRQADTIILHVSYIGYAQKTSKIAGRANARLDIFLEMSVYEMDEVVVSADRNDRNVNKAQMGTVNVPLRAINTLPVLGGERDILKVIQFLPGVQQGNEGTAAFFVRGGNADQNLVQLDEATIYNPNHLFGLFSTFNINAIKSITLTKGGFPAKYGGRLSSILDISMKDGNKEFFELEGGVGLLSSNLTVQGPLQKGKSSFILSGRRSFLDLIAKIGFLPEEVSTTKYILYDVNAKLNFELGKNDHLFLSFFKGKDYASYIASSSMDFNIAFGNTTGTIRWNHLFGNKLFCNTSVIFNDYHLGLATNQLNYYSLLYTGINDVTAKSDFTCSINPDHVVKAGFSYTYHTLYPGSLSEKIPKTGNKLTIDRNTVPRRYSNEWAFYASDELKLANFASVNVGLRVPVFHTTQKTYSFVEPRLTARFSINQTSSIKASYTQMNQFLHLIPNSTASLPADIWLSSNAKIKPQNSVQYALGFFKNFSNNEIETSIEIYYKTMDNQVLFKEGTQIGLNTDLDATLTFGSGKSYGIEFFARKNFGKLTGWVSYTLSKTTQKFAELNFGKVFPFTYDRPHNLAVAAMYELSKRWTFAADFTFYSGIAYTIPVGKVFIANDGGLYDGVYYDYYGRNNARLKPYHRLDVSFLNRKTVTAFGKKCEREWVFGIYNVYSRLNPYYVYLYTDPATKLPKAKQVSLLPIIPSVSFNFKF